MAFLQVEAQWQMGGLGDSNPGGLDNGAALRQKVSEGVVLRDQQGRGWVAQVGSVQLAVDTHGLTQFGRAVRKTCGFGDVTMPGQDVLA